MRYGKVLVVSLFVLSSVFGLQFGRAATVAAVDLESLLPGEVVPEENTIISPAYVSGVPQLLSASSQQSTAATLSWTATGKGNVQDTYDIRVSAQPPIEGEEPQVGDDVLDVPGHQSSSYPVNDFTEGIKYYWQVRSCEAALLGTCSDWSVVGELTIDNTPPQVPTAAVTSDKYDTTVHVAGTAEVESQVRVLVGDKTCTTTADVHGDWLCIFKEDFDFGDYTATVRSLDAAGNASETAIDFSVKEFFIATTIDTEALPPVLEVVTISKLPKNEVGVLPVTSAADVTPNEYSDDNGVVAGAVAPLSTEGGIVQASANGWQLFGLPWFIWIGLAGIISAIWYAILQRRQPHLTQAAA